jgi:predicted acetyltransferase
VANRGSQGVVPGGRAGRLPAPTQWLEAASEDFAGFVAARRGVGVRWGVPSTVFWYVSGEYYLGTLVIRHQLTPELAETGGHIGFHVVAPWRRQGHATRMLTAGLEQCRPLGLYRVLLTCAADNEPSRRVILANGGVPDGQAGGEDRFWINLGHDNHPSSWLTPSCLENGCLAHS